MSMICFENVDFSYDGGAFEIRDMNLNIEKGQFVALVGGNGSGKSTLAKLMCALLAPTSGRVLIDGDDTADETATYLIRSKTGLVFQNPDDQLVASLVENDVAFGPENLGEDEKTLRDTVRRALAEVGLAGFEKREVDSLSGGQKQRCAIAGALAMNPAVLILDEASSMLDPSGRDELMQTVHTLHAAGMTIVMITHFMEEAACAERVIVLDGGNVVMDGTPHEVFSRTSELAACQLMPPFAVRLSQALRANGIPVNDCVTDDELEEELCALPLST